MAVAAPVILAEMAEWVKLGGGNSGIVGDANHSFGFHLSANDASPSDYSRTNDPNGPNGPFVDWNYACAGDFSHGNNETLRMLHRLVLSRLMRGELPMICEFIGKPWADRPVLYWARWNGVATTQNYTGSGHDTWSHISWYRSKVDQRANLWTTTGGSGGSGMAAIDDMIKSYNWALARGATRYGDGAVGEAYTWWTGAVNTSLKEIHSKLDAMAKAIASVKGVDTAALEAKLEAARAESAAAMGKLQTAVGQVDEEVLARIGEGATPEQTAQLLRTALGARAEAVFRAGLGS